MANKCAAWIGGADLTRFQDDHRRHALSSTLNRSPDDPESETGYGGNRGPQHSFIADHLIELHGSSSLAATVIDSASEVPF